MEMYEEAMAYMRAALSPGSVGFKGRHFELAEFDPQPRPKNLRLMGGGAGKPKARRIIALYGDEYNIYATDPVRYREIVDLTRQEAAAFGRDPDEISWTTASPGLAAKKDSDYRRLVEQLAERTNQTTEHIEKTFESRGYPHGPGAKGAEMIAALEEAGCQRYYPQVFLDEDDLSDFDTILDAYQG
jgi:alkanesulfonate monooxygenase SsuD/methylene tetrahydromethanopterin reductase-like flavin-dependent oxidoreductase (luciferase family)